ncbi:MAG: hypothetical protein WD342_20525 [Verrucomicrobiales bacterium]
MSSESKIDLLNRILDARLAAKESRAGDKAGAWAEYERLIDEALEDHPEISGEDLEKAMLTNWRDYCRKRRRYG